MGEESIEACGEERDVILPGFVCFRKGRSFLAGGESPTLGNMYDYVCMLP